MFKKSDKNINNENIKQIVWKDIKIGDIFLDGSKVIKKHDKYIADCYEINGCILSNTHLLLCDISKCSTKLKKWIDEEFGSYSIPTLYDKHVYFENLDETIRKYEDENRAEDGLVKMTYDQINNMLSDSQSQKMEVIESDKCKVSENIYWLNITTIENITKILKEKIYLLSSSDVEERFNKKVLNAEKNNSPFINKYLIINGRTYIRKNINSIKYVGKREVFCVETDSHKFETCGMVHHNSVTLRNIIFHCLTHGQEICIGLVDLKFTEFTYFKAVNNVVAVANTVKEAAELLRLMRECMYKRNEEMSRLIPPVNDIKDYKPKKPTDEYMIYNRKFNGDDEVEIRLKNGEIKKVKVKEIEQYMD